MLAALIKQPPDAGHRAVGTTRSYNPDDRRGGPLELRDGPDGRAWATLAPEERAAGRVPGGQVEPRRSAHRSWHQGSAGQHRAARSAESSRRWASSDIDTGGYRITTTIDQKMQKAARRRRPARKGNERSDWEAAGEADRRRAGGDRPGTGGCSPTTAGRTAPASTTPARTTTRRRPVGGRPAPGLDLQDLHAGRRAAGGHLVGQPLEDQRLPTPGLQGHRSVTPAGGRSTPAARESRQTTAPCGGRPSVSYNVPFFTTSNSPSGRAGRRGQSREGGPGRRHHACGRTTTAKPHDLTEIDRRHRAGAATRSTTWSPSASTRSRCSTTPTASPPSPPAASTTRRTSSTRWRCATRRPASGRRSAAPRSRASSGSRSRSRTTSPACCPPSRPAATTPRQRPSGRLQDRHLGAPGRGQRGRLGGRLHPADRDRGVGR